MSDWDDMQAAGVVDAVEAVFDEAPRLSPAARWFMSGEMPHDVAVMYGYARGCCWWARRAGLAQCECGAWLVE